LKRDLLYSVFYNNKTTLKTFRFEKLQNEAGVSLGLLEFIRNRNRQVAALVYASTREYSR